MQLAENEACRKQIRNPYKIFVRKDHLRDPGINGRIL
jgi:hypothetical protein